MTISPKINKKLPRPILCILALAGGLLFPSCQTTDAGSEVGHYEVAVSSTPMFRYGPAQSFGADFSLAQGQHVVMLRREHGYSRVMTDEGQTGYVATEDLRPTAVPQPSASPRGNPAHLTRLPPRGTWKPGISSANNEAVIQGGPLFGGDELPPLPERDPLQGNAQPGFRIHVPQRKPPSPTTPANPKPGFRVHVKERAETVKKP